MQIDALFGLAITLALAAAGPTIAGVESGSPSAPADQNTPLMLEDSPAPLDGVATTDPDDARAGDTREVESLVDPNALMSPDMAAFAFGSLGLLAGEILGLGTFFTGSVVFVATFALAIGGGGVLPILGLVGSFGVLLVGLFGFGPLSAMLAAGAAAAAAETHHLSGLPLILGSLPGLAVGIAGGLLAGVSFFVIGPGGFITQGLALFAGSVEALPVEFLTGFALQAAAGPIALAGAFGAAYFFRDSLDEAVGEQNLNRDATPAVAFAPSRARPTVGNFVPLPALSFAMQAPLRR